MTRCTTMDAGIRNRDMKWVVEFVGDVEFAPMMA